MTSAPPAPFHPFTSEHFFAVLTGAAITTALIVAGRRSHRGHLISTGILAFLNLAAYPMVQFAWRNYENPGIENLLPFQLCDFAAVLAGFALLTRRRLLCELTYFWGLAATIQGLVTPAIQVGYPQLPYFAFFIQHFSIVAAALYMPLADDWRPDRPWWRSPLRALLWANAYILFAITVNSLLHANFGFAAHKPANPSLLDHLGPWPWYLFGMEALAGVFFLILSLPFIRPPRPLK